MGLRETKKQQTRQAIADAALPLFLERGFDKVTVAEVAREVGVSGQTIFNYFPTKEDLFFDRQAEAEDQLASLVRNREPGTCPVEAIRDDVLTALKEGRTEFPGPDDARRFWRAIQDSPALSAREREIAERTEIALAGALEENAATTAPALLAGAISGLHRAVQRELRHQILTGERGARSRADMMTATRTAFDTLCHGLHRTEA
ncbi:TetR/AcrR family transcriptional regulator [Streptomyces sp. AM 3-1-1]|uniref:TetR/AcrR family transcriptional regulator n=1 Tax=Streptomyces sp. AM 3-1-1 TaxID=3028711 RepID=UPI0023B89CFC|nr:TetR/AcrR family transcriptional regulator [Streptomyces sp. AM 3-1-1]WEH29139.1 TetR/AcrR family transcriptional regulator [Streptomyces sp. AM 3-1-1]